MHGCIDNTWFITVLWLQGLGAEDIRVIAERFVDCFNRCWGGFNAFCDWPHSISIVSRGQAASCAGVLLELRAAAPGRGSSLARCIGVKGG